MTPSYRKVRLPALKSKERENNIREKLVLTEAYFSSPKHTLFEDWDVFPEKFNLSSENLYVS